MKNAIIFSLMGLFASNAIAQTAVELTTQVNNPENLVLLGDSFQRTLYVFDPDQGQAVPQCNADCAEKWPPYTLSPAEIASLQAPLGVIKRANNMAQLTYEGRPVYTFFLDRVVGDDLGDGLGDVWHTIVLNGTK